jgi:transketolase
LFAGYQEAHPQSAAQFRTMTEGRLLPRWRYRLPRFDGDSRMATRAASGKVLTAIVPEIPQLIGGSADLSGSNKTLVEGMRPLQKDDWQGQYLHYGVREHGMGAIMNGLAVHGGVIPYGGTFLVFSDYMRASIRLAAMMGLRVIYVFSHDSIGLGEDGPTHQPIEQLMALRAIPNLWVVRPADANETAAAWRIALERTDGPTALVLTRQAVPLLDRKLAEHAVQGAYAIGASRDDQAAILATGSEVGIALIAQEELVAQGISTRVVSMPCWELFAAQPDTYKNAVLPDRLTARVSIEAGVTMGWREYLGPQGIALGLDHFGASAPFGTLYREFGLTVEAVVEAVKEVLSR